VPELPEVEAVTRNLRAAAPWARIVAAGQWRPTSAENLSRAVGDTLTGVARRGKHILLALQSGATLEVHLRMTGHLLVLPDARFRGERARVWLDLEDGRAVVLDDPRALGRVKLWPAGANPCPGLGPEANTPDFSEQYLQSALHGSKRPIKLALLDQSLVAGLGNIYAAEALFQAAIHPARPAGRLAAPRLRRLHRSIVGVLELALDSAIRAYGRPGGFSKGENFPLAVYGRAGEPCPRCGALVRRIAQGGRSTYYCPRCQR